MNKRAILQTEEYVVRSTNPVLLIDKTGEIGNNLALELAKDFLVVYAGKEKIKSTDRVIHIPYRKKILSIPNNSFSNIFLIISEEGEGLDLLMSLVKKAKENNSRLVIVIPYTAKEAQIKEIEKYSIHVYPITLFVYGDVFGNNEGKIDALLLTARRTNILALPGDGLNESYPVHITTITQEIIRVTFLTENTQQVFLLLQKFAATDLSIARSITKAMSEIHVQFKKQIHKPTKRYIPRGEYVIEDFLLDEKIKEMSDEKIEIVKKNKSTKKNSKIKKWIFLTIILLILTPFLITFFFAGIGLIMVQSGLAEVKRGELVSSEKRFSIAKNTFYIASQTGESAHVILSIVGLKDKGQSLLLLIRSGEQLSEAGTSFVSAGLTYKNILTGVTNNSTQDAQIATQKLRRALTIIQKIKTEKTLPKEIRREIDKNNDVILFANNIADLIPEILGVTGNRKYLLLFQNNMELRPGGGFIGSYAVLSINKGKIGEIAINDVYDADGLLKGHVEPPFALRRFGGIKHWYLRDSNFHVDFEENARKAMYFLNLETGENVDGVLAIDTEVLKNLIKLYEPLQLPQYNQEVTSENIIMLTQVESQDNFFPGSTQKKDFLNALKKELLVKLNEKNETSFESLMRLTKQAMSQKHAMFVLKDERSQKILSAVNISGKLPQLKNEKNKVSDFLMISEANIGGTKGNMYLKRDVIHNIRLLEDTVQEELKIRYNNTSKLDSKYGGDYTGYLQLVLAKNTILKSVKINNVEQSILPAVTDPELYESQSFTPEEGIEVVTENLTDKSVFGFPIRIQAGKRQTIIVNYEVPVGESISNYSLITAKQPGTLADPHLLRIYYPENKKPISLNGLEDKGNRGEYRNNLLEDKKVNILFDN